jgi:MraZ protein
MFRGSSAVSIDVKGRLAVPARFREVLTGMGTDILILSRSFFDPCLWAFPLPEWEALVKKLNEMPLLEEGAREHKRMMLANAFETQLDSQGRILVPQDTRASAGIDRRTMVLGQGNKLELWDETVWHQRHEAWLKAISSGSSATANVLASLGL